MTAVRFYHLEQKTLDQALPEILGKALSGDHRIVVKIGDKAQLPRMNDHLWTFSPQSFLPHGTEKDGHAEEQPIWLTDKDENPNQADVLILTDGATSENIADYNLCCEMLDGRNPEAVSAARARWKSYKEQSFEISYWQQDEAGRWQNKA
jgi:DNA polymerase-3 subunit chi